MLSGCSSEGKNVLLGVVLMARETVDNYVWLLENLLIMNQGLFPKLIITDLESSKVTAIEQVLAPRTVHLLC